MGKCETYVRKVLFVLYDELTEVYVAVDAVADCPMGVQGWHHKTFPASKSMLDILQGLKDGTVENYLLWPLDAPN